jgi:hypothetical protein
MLNLSTFADTADNYAIIHFVPHPCQHITVDQSHSSGDTVAKIPEISRQWRPNPQKKSHTGLNLATGVATALTRHLLVLLLLTFIERHICYYCLLAANHGNYMRGL